MIDAVAAVMKAVGTLWVDIDTGDVGANSAVDFVQQRTLWIVVFAALTLLAGAPTIAGAWIGGYVTSDLLGVLFLSAAAGAALQVVVEIGRYVLRTAPGGLASAHVLAGFVAGIAVMYLTGLLAA